MENDFKHISKEAISTLKKLLLNVEETISNTKKMYPKNEISSLFRLGLIIDRITCSTLMSNFSMSVVLDSFLVSLLEELSNFYNIDLNEFIINSGISIKKNTTNKVTAKELIEYINEKYKYDNDFKKYISFYKYFLKREKDFKYLEYDKINFSYIC
jgi:hypothetical protein